MGLRPPPLWCQAFAAVLACAATWTSAAPPVGAPLVQRLGPDDYGAAPALWSVATAPGKVYVASADGVLIHDGVEWTTVPLPVGVDATVVRRITDGTVMVGGIDTYGRLEHDPIDGYRYVDLLASSGLGNADRRLGPVWAILETPAGLHVQSQNFLHHVPSDGGATRSWPLGPEVRGLMASGGELYLRIEGRGLGRWRESGFQLLPGGDVFETMPVASVFGWGGARYVVAADGVWRLDDRGVTSVLSWPGGRIEVYAAVALEEGGFIVATLDGELIVVDAALRLRQRFALAEQSIVDLARDAEGMLWVLTDSEIYRVGLPSPWSLLNRAQGLRGMIADTAEFDGALWAVGSRGVFRIAGDGAGGTRAEAMPWGRLEAYALLADERAMLVAEREGLRQLRPGTRSPDTLIEGRSVYALQPVRARDNLAIAYSDDAFYLLAFGAGGWGIDARWPLDGMRVLDVVQTAAGEFWLSDDRGPPQRWRIDPERRTRIDVTVFGPDEGLPAGTSERPRLFQIDGSLYAWLQGRTYRHDAGQDRFVDTPTPEWITALAQPARLGVVETPAGLFAHTPRDLLHRPAAAMAWERVQIGGWSTTGFGVPRVDRSGILRVPVWNGLLQYASDGPKPALPPLAVAFDRLWVEGDDGVARPAVIDDGRLPLLSGQPLRLRFGLGTLEPGARFRYRLEGIVPDFTDWADRDLAIRGLDAGVYTFEVEGQLPSRRTIAPLQLRLVVAPRWYERTALRVLLALGLAGLAVWAVRVFGRRRLKRVEDQNRQLEKRIADRTLELERANQRLAEMAVEDALTGVQNRRALEQALGREWARCAEQALPLAALMIDVDHFKRYNDQHGHLDGDRVLAGVAAQLRTDLNPPLDVLARYGGEEFTVLLPGATPDAAARRAERLREAVANARLGVTVSIGVAVVWPGGDEAPTQLMRQADQALYEAKRLGRNRVVCADA